MDCRLWIAIWCLCLTACADQTQGPEAVNFPDSMNGFGSNPADGDTSMSVDRNVTDEDISNSDMMLTAAPEMAGDDFGTAATTEISAETYCESTVEMFCGFYLRCNRMAASSFEDCREIFLETCNRRYEPSYIALAGAGYLTLSEQGIRNCETHLANVDCDAQVFDLDGGCSGVWQGLGQEAHRCSYGIESFVCAPGFSCELDTTLCGQCERTSQSGDSCDNNQPCIGPFFCAGGLCQPRGLPGAPCLASGQCVVGSRCDSNLCQAPIRAGLGDACDQIRRCPYKSQCVGGICEETARLNEPCQLSIGCMSGYCDEVCRAFKTVGETCETNAECAINRCNDGQCGPSVSACLMP